MLALREKYLVDNNGNNYFLIDKEGMVVANPFNLSSFHKLKRNVANLFKEKRSSNWQPSPIFWRNLGLFTLFLLLLAGIYIQRKRILAKRELQRRQLLESELKGIRAQMNPHFLFNALSSIQNLIRKKDGQNADRYLTQFAGLVRKILRNSEKEFITLEEEIAAIQQYCSLEALRQPFDYEINISDNIDIFNTYIPGMILQPIVENAILHGLMPKTENRKLWINIEKQGDDLACEIIDNGIGMDKAKKQIQSHKIEQKSYGLQLVRQRLQLLSNSTEKAIINILDRSDLNPLNSGTIVKLMIPRER
jgi:sensor histidine kinase YesM